jgi:hypothetical protein
MTWAKVDDTMWAHRKVRRAGIEAMGLWILALSYCAQHNTGGLILLDEAIDLCKGNRKLAVKLSDALVAAGLWEAADGGWQFHDWHHYQPSKEFRDAQRERGRRGAESRWRSDRHATANGDPDGDRHGTRHSGKHENANGLPVPSRPSRPPIAHAREADPEPDNPPAQSDVHAAKLRELVTNLGERKAMP